jgi:uncharacterized membrane protein HdeD (DUF308 family)
VLLNPLNTRDVFEVQEAEGVASSWWLFLASGVVSIVFGLLILSIDWSLDGLAAFIGTFFILLGVAYLVTPPLDGGTRSTNVVLGLVGIAAGIVLLAWPDRGLYTLAIFIGAWLIASGLIHIVGAFTNRSAPLWWLVLIMGLIETPLGIWAIRRPGLTLVVLITLTGIWAVVGGIWQCVIAFEVKNLPRRLRGLRPTPTS